MLFLQTANRKSYVRPIESRLLRWPLVTFTVT